MTEIQIPPERLSAVEKILSDPADDTHTAYQALRRRVTAAATSEKTLAQWEAAPHAHAENLGAYATARLQTTELVTLLHNFLGGELPSQISRFIHWKVLQEWARCADCRRATRVSLRHIFSGAGLLPLPEDIEKR